MELEKERSIFIFSVGGILILITEPLYRDPLYNLSLQHIPVIQSTIGEGIISTFLIYISYLASYKVYMTLLVIVYFVCPRQTSYFLFISTGIVLTIEHILSTVYAAPPPYNSNPLIHPYACAMGYTSPSGEALFCTYFYLTLGLTLFYPPLHPLLPPPIQLPDAASQDIQYTFTHRVILIFKYYFMYKIIKAWMLLPFIYLADIYTGIHSYNQTLFGSLLGIYLFLLFWRYREVIMLSIGYLGRGIPGYSGVIIGLGGIWAGTVIMTVFWNIKTGEVTPGWARDVDICGISSNGHTIYTTNTTNTINTIERSNELDVSYSTKEGLYLLQYIGILFGPCLLPRLINYDKWYPVPFHVHIKRIILLIFLLSPIFIIRYLVTYQILGSFSGIVIIDTLPYFYFGFILYGIIDWMGESLGFGVEIPRREIEQPLLE